MTRAVVITGASSGIGAACVRRFLDDGWQVAGLARRIATVPTGAMALAVDLTDAGAVDAAGRKIAAWQPRIQAVICAAGDFLVQAMDSPMASVEFERIWRVTVWSKFYLVRMLLPLLAPPAAVVHVASLAAHRDFADETAYMSAMHGVMGLARAQDAELKPRGIRVAVVSPGLVRTPLTERAFPAEVLEDALAPEAIAGSAAMLIATCRGGGYIPEIFHLPQNST